jgi:hypothetical protein
MIAKSKKNDFPYEIYCDMDGVLVDLFENGIYPCAKDPKMLKNVKKVFKRRLNWTEPVKNRGIQAAIDWVKNLLSNDYEFWASLKPLPGTFRLWRHLAFISTPKILSHPMDEECIEGKKYWIQKYLFPNPEKYDILLPLDGKKEKWATDKEGKPCILIDDFEIYTEAWEKSGGIAILHTSVAKTISTLTKLEEDYYERNGKQ